MREKEGLMGKNQKLFKLIINNPKLSKIFQDESISEDERISRVIDEFLKAPETTESILEMLVGKISSDDDEE